MTQSVAVTFCLVSLCCRKSFFPALAPKTFHLYLIGHQTKKVIRHTALSQIPVLDCTIRNVEVLCKSFPIHPGFLFQFNQIICCAHMFIFVAMGECPQTCMNKLRAAPLLRVLANHVVVCYRPTHSHPAPRRPLWRPCVALMHAKQYIAHSVGARKCPQDRICKHIRLCGRLLAVYSY